MYELLTLEGAASTYDAVMHLAEVTRARLRLTICEHRYEHLVDNFEEAVSAVCRFIDVPFRSEMIAFHLTAKTQDIRSPSARQVRRSLYRKVSHNGGATPGNSNRCVQCWRHGSNDTAIPRSERCLPKKKRFAILPEPRSPRVLEIALRHLNSGEYAEAEILLRPLAAIPDADALQLLGILRGLQGQFAEAEHFYLQSLQLKPNQPQVQHNLGNLLRSQGRVDEAIAALREAIRLKPNYAEAHLSLALACSAKGDHREAEKICRQALRLQPNYILAKQCLAAELNDLDRPAEAERLLRQVLTLGVSEFNASRSA